MVSTNIFSSLSLGIGINLDIASILNYIIIIIFSIFKLYFFIFLNSLLCIKITYVAKITNIKADC